MGVIDSVDYTIEADLNEEFKADEPEQVQKAESEALDPKMAVIARKVNSSPADILIITNAILDHVQARVVTAVLRNRAKGIPALRKVRTSAQTKKDVIPVMSIYTDSEVHLALNTIEIIRQGWQPTRRD